VLIVQATLMVGEAILIEAGLSFLGLGIQPPAVSWGNMLTRAQEYLYYPNGIFLALFPGLFIFMTVLCFNFVGDGLRDALDPRSTHRV
jgi:peptide/nickel transport system permease protein